jgi:transposase
VRVFAGNTSDKSTVAEQIRTLAKSFGVEEITLVGDKGMIKSPQAQELTDAGFHYITSLSKPEIRSLLREEVLQMDFFDTKLYEVEHVGHGVRYVLRRNPVRQQEMGANRKERIGRIERYVEEKNQYLAGSEKRQESVAHEFLKAKIKRYNLSGIVEISCQNRKFEIVIDEATLQDKALLDGCYVIKTDVKKEAFSAEQVHDRYKDLAKVEHAFRTFKQGHLEIRPVHVRTEASTRGHVFSVMLAYRIERQLAEYWKNLDCTVPGGLDELGAIHSTIVTLKEASCQKIPEPSRVAKALLDAMQVRLPEVIEARHVVVVTRKKISKSRK